MPSSASSGALSSSALWLSRLRINALKPEAQRDLADCQRMHTRLLSAFPDDPDVTQARAHYGLLYRVESEPAMGGAVVALAQSRAEPDWSRLPEGYLTEAAKVKSLVALYDALREGMTLRFRLHANPTRRIRSTNQQEEARWHGKRVNLRTEAEQLAWLCRKGEAHGFVVLDAQARRYQPLGVSMRDPGSPNVQGARRARGTASPVLSGLREGTGALTFGSVVFEGSLRVSDLARMREALASGIGAGKAYGFGLLSIAPATFSAGMGGQAPQDYGEQ